jgi:hypothetical protein
VVGDKPEDEGRNWDAKSNHHCPDTYIPRSVLLEKCLGDNSTANCGCWANEEGHNSSAKSHSGIGRALRAADVADATNEQGEEEQRPSSVRVRERLPYKRSYT